MVFAHGTDALKYHCLILKKVSSFLFFIVYAKCPGLPIPDYSFLYYTCILMVYALLLGIPLTMAHPHLHSGRSTPCVQGKRDDSCSEIKHSSLISTPTNPVFLFLWSAYCNTIYAGAAVVRCDVRILADDGTLERSNNPESLMASRGLPRNVIAVVDTTRSQGSWRASGNE